jgi:hypothetical protein
MGGGGTLRLLLFVIILISFRIFTHHLLRKKRCKILVLMFHLQRKCRILLRKIR